MNPESGDPRHRLRYNHYRIWMAVRIVVVGTMTSTIFIAVVVLMNPPLEERGFYLFHFGSTVGSMNFVGAVTWWGGVDVGVGHGRFPANPNAYDDVRGLDLFGFVLSDIRHHANNANFTSHWFIFGLPWWYVVALFVSRRLDRLALRHGMKADAERLELRRKREAMDGWEDWIRFQDKPVCQACGYDMRATLERCPECGWVPDFPKPEQKRVRESDARK